eukprot:COSAG02_NODE_16195_length_1105_cov_1.957256_2_plen_176_part_00
MLFFNSVTKPTAATLTGILIGGTLIGGIVIGGNLIGGILIRGILIAVILIGGILIVILAGWYMELIQAVLGIISVVSIFLPLYFSLSVARISTACKDLLMQLNIVRMGDLDHHSRLLALETALRNLNQQQGLGIVLGFTGIVLDMKTLKQIGFTVGPVVTTAVSILLGYYHQARL